MIARGILLCLCPSGADKSPYYEISSRFHQLPKSTTYPNLLMPTVRRCWCTTKQGLVTHFNSGTPELLELGVEYWSPTKVAVITCGNDLRGTCKI